MKIALALPPYGLTKSYGGAGTKKRGILPPLGVGYLAAYAAGRGHQTVFIDGPALNHDIETEAAAILAEKPDVVGISCLTRLAPNGYALAGALKNRAPEIPIIMGGPHVSSFWQNILGECPHVDILIPGEGEETLAEVLDRLDQQASCDSVQGVIFRDDHGNIVTNPPRPAARDLDVFPHPLRTIYQHELYIPLPNQCRRTPATTVITARGCPYGRCAFCYQGGLYASPYRRRSPENVIDEIARLKRDYGIREIIFWDDNFVTSPKWMDTFCSLLDREKLDITWTVQSRVNTVSEEILKRMAASGCYNIHFGLESGNQQMLKVANKGITLDQSRAAVKAAKKAGLEVRASFIIAMPTETPAMAEETIRFACELNVDYMIFYPFHFQPGTPLTELARREGTILPEGTDMHQPSYVPVGYDSPEQISAIIRSAYRRYYLRPRYLARALWRARNPLLLRNYIQAFWYWFTLSFFSSHH
ncbi:MAG TPA: radical SAM protein [Candidatus Hydrogenedentes bacterium]|nr:radical SAM protein [Candidatus Hydrogenedentota bacterium]